MIEMSSRHYWNPDYPSGSECVFCKAENKGKIECFIGGMVNPNKLCPKIAKNITCAWSIGCSSYEAYLNDEDSYKPDKDSEALLIEPLQIRLRLREIYWKFRAKLSEFKDWVRYIWKLLKENVDIIIAFAPIAFFIVIAILILSGILKVHIEF